MVCGFPASTVGVARTVISTVDVTAGHGDMPVVVSVRVAVPVKPMDGVQVAFKSVTLENVPGAGVDHIPPVADPPTEPDNVTEPP